MRHFASPAFWRAYRRLPEPVRRLADRSFDIMKTNPRHPGLNLKRIGRIWSARVGLGYRALGADAGGDIVWFWIGSHADYDKMLKR
ncbi:MAG: type II toxin-antitoxin system RelE family toxin [Propylenella sp.]